MDSKSTKDKIKVDLKKITAFLLLICLSCLVHGGKNSRTSLYFNIKGDIPVHNIEFSNNPAGGGIGGTFLFDVKSKFKLMFEVDYDRFINMKIKYEAPPSRTIIESGISTIFAGLLYSPEKRYNLSISAGTCFFNSDICFVLKPDLGLYLGREKKYLTELSLTNIFRKPENYTTNKGTFSFLNLTFKVRLF